MAESKKFHERFDIDLGVEEAKRRFVNRVYNHLSASVFEGEYGFPAHDCDCYMEAIASRLGEQFIPRQFYFLKDIRSYIQDDFLRSLEALEGLYSALDTYYKLKLESFIHDLLHNCERDLGIRWEDGAFVPQGARLLDERLVNDPLHWLRENPSLATVLTPFENGLHHFVEAQKKPNVLNDVITNMYLALEGLAKITTGHKADDLSANRELFLSKIKAPESYKRILKDYIEYANEIARHAPEKKPRTPSPWEVESFIYLTGLFIRMTIQAGLAA